MGLVYYPIYLVDFYGNGKDNILGGGVNPFETY